ncbi:unnamed protein product [Dibothriocephalus latus]|uniref:Reverse transcriptase domain-containing protein n=1 Tax=Dibothriocephalus latus TaxID=60516 RepID=A0A3P7M7A0_DIBLA|nr:unnamed protein product [Dibothriocephalus latus]
MKNWTTAIEAKDTIRVAYIAFRKAFDSVPYQCLMHKLTMVDKRGKLLMCIEGQRSTSTGIESGVPQGLVLGPTLFILFFNDCAQKWDCERAMFSDDVKIWKIIKSAADEDDCQEWSRRWILSFNLNKCNLLRLRTRNQVPDAQSSYLHRIPLQEVEIQEVLGIWMTDNNTTSKKCCKAVKAATTMLYAIQRAFTILMKTAF